MLEEKKESEWEGKGGGGSQGGGQREGGREEGAKEGRHPNRKGSKIVYI